MSNAPVTMRELLDAGVAGLHAAFRVVARGDDRTAVLASLEQAFAQFETFVSTLEQQSASAASPSGRAAVQVKAGAAQAVAAHMQDMLKAM